MGKLDGKHILITGATSGIGAAMAFLFATEGGAVYVVGRNEEKGKKVVDSIHHIGGTAIFYSCDVTNEKDIIALKNKIRMGGAESRYIS